MYRAPVETLNQGTDESPQPSLRSARAARARRLKMARAARAAKQSQDLSPIPSPVEEKNRRFPVEITDGLRRSAGAFQLLEGGVARVWGESLFFEGPVKIRLFFTSAPYQLQVSALVKRQREDQLLLLLDAESLRRLSSRKLTLTPVPAKAS